MHIIKLDAIDSTNSYLRKMASSKKVEDYTIVIAENQTKGRGQMGTIWQSEDGKNLLFSVFKEFKNLHIDNSFYVSATMSLSILKVLKEFNIPNLKVKWPNDILSDTDKVCGILIENVIKNNKLSSCVIGIGLNVNQTEFKNLTKATSLKLTTGVTHDLDEILHKIMIRFKQYFHKLNNKEFKEIKQEYELYLFRNNKPSTFMDIEGKLFSGYIKGIGNSGKLKVLLEDNISKEFDMKEVTLMY